MGNNSYRAIVDKSLAEIYKWPAGWDTREKVALDLGCAVERVSDTIASALKAGLVERKMHRVFRDGRVQLVPGYRRVTGDKR